MELSNIIKMICNNYYMDSMFNIVEAGCWNGYDTMALCKIFPNATIYGFEPDIRQYNDLVKISQSYSNFIFDNRALSSEDGESKFYLGTNQHGAFGSSSILDPNIDNHKNIHGSLSYNESILVKTVSLDSWAKENNISKIDFAWFDLQGAEGAVIKNSNIINTADIIYSEVNLIEIYKDAILYKEYRNMLESKGFVVIIEQLPWEDAGNVLFVKKEIKNVITYIAKQYEIALLNDGAKII